MATCARCSGLGAIECPACEGCGRIRGPAWLPGMVEALASLNEDPAARDRCAKCGGAGKVPCPECNAAGEVEDDDG